MCLDLKEMVINQQSASGRAQQAVQCRRRREEGRGQTPVEIVCSLHEDNSDPLLTQELYALHMLRAKHLHVALFPMMLLLSGIPCLVKLDIFMQSSTAFKTTLKTPWYLSNPTDPFL